MINFPHFLVLLSILISFVGAYTYIRDTLSGHTKPNRISWTMWAISPLIGTGAALAAGAEFWTAARIFLAGFIPLLVLLSSFFNKQSYWKLSLFDCLCGVASFAALILWCFMNNPVTAILLAAIGDGFACIPTLIKAWRSPETETGSSYIASFISVLLVIPSMPAWDIPNSAFQIYLLLANFLLITFIYRKKFPRLFVTRSAS